MIMNIILGVIYALLWLVTSLLPAGLILPVKISSAVSYFVAHSFFLNAYLPMSDVWQVSFWVILVETGLLSFRIIRWFVGLIRGVGVGV